MDSLDRMRFSEFQEFFTTVLTKKNLIKSIINWFDKNLIE